MPGMLAARPRRVSAHEQATALAGDPRGGCGEPAPETADAAPRTGWRSGPRDHDRDRNRPRPDPHRSRNGRRRPPERSRSQTPAAGPLSVEFGLDLDKDTYLVTQPTSSFEVGDPFAYSVNPPVNPGVPQVYVSIITFRAGTEVVLQEPTAQRLLPEPASFGYKTTTNDMIELFGYGRFTMKIYLDPAGPVYAQGRFEIVEPSVPQE